MKLFFTAMFLAVGIHLLTFGSLVLLWLMHAAAATPPFLLLAYGDSSVEGMEVDVVTVDPGAECYACYASVATAGRGEPIPVAIMPAEQLAPPLLPLEPVVEAEALPLEAEQPASEEEKPVPVEELKPVPPTLPTDLRPPVLEPAVNVARLAASATATVGGAPLPRGTPSRGGTVGSRTGVRMVGLPRPVYPREAVLRGVEGRVVLFLRISAEGRVTEVKINESSGYKVLDDAALEFGKSLRFVPAREDQHSVSATALYPVRYQLTETR